ncbi:MAG: hypothetical protein A2176_10180 [Spirochaetes bacterium RBG_13_51_14]|nr:MAG: hypothetical protein A2176_10180 [Spirochaetes bacterium RBG_13_51_14]
MKKWIKKAEEEIIRRRIFSVKDIECYHPGKDLTHTYTSTFFQNGADLLTTTNICMHFFNSRLSFTSIYVRTAAGMS